MGSRTASGDYDEAARARWAGEPQKHAARGPFERDRARVLHSAALRRLAAKTQVVGPQSNDFVRNRLTHTLEVAQVARDLARRLGCDPDVAETAALAHDLGHPPFGHNGERALDELCQEAGGFEGNAQTLRILTRLEAKTFDGAGRSVGMNLTRASLDAATKYPWPRDGADAPFGAHSDGTLRTVSKFGVYDADLDAFAWVREGAPPGRRCLEAQVMDLADDVAYSVHDLEDGVVAGSIDLATLADPGLRRDVWDTVRAWYLRDASDDVLEAAYSRLVALPAWPASAYDGRRRTMGALKNLTSDLIGRFCAGVTEATQAEFGSAPLARYAADVVVPEEILTEVVVLKGIAAELVMKTEDRLDLQVGQRRLLAELVQAIRARGREALDETFAEDFDEAEGEAGRLRVVMDQVASLTDASAQQWHARLA